MSDGCDGGGDACGHGHEGGWDGFGADASAGGGAGDGRAVGAGRLIVALVIVALLAIGMARVEAALHALG